MQCPYCKGSSYYEDDNGYFNCNICGTQSQHLFSESFETEQFSGRIIGRMNPKIKSNTSKIELNIHDYLEVFQSMLLTLLKTFVSITKDDGMKPTVKRIWFSYLELWSKSDQQMLSSLLSQKQSSLSTSTKSSKSTSTSTTTTKSEIKELPIPSKPLLLGIIYLALRIRKSWILPSDIIRWISNGKIPYITLLTFVPDHVIRKFRSNTHIHKIFGRDNLLSQQPISAMNILFHSILLSQLLHIKFSSLNGPLSCYTMILSLGLPYHIIWPLLTKLCYINSYINPIEEFQLNNQYYSESIVLSVFTTCQLSPHWLTTWSYEPCNLINKTKPQDINNIKFNRWDTYHSYEVAEEPPVILKLKNKFHPLSQSYQQHSYSQNYSQDYPRNSKSTPFDDYNFIPKSLSEMNYNITRENLTSFLNYVELTVRRIDKSTTISTSDSAGFLSFNKTIENILQQTIPNGQTFGQSLQTNIYSSMTSSISSRNNTNTTTFTPSTPKSPQTPNKLKSNSYVNSHNNTPSFLTSSSKKRFNNNNNNNNNNTIIFPSYDNSIYFSGSTILLGNPITYSKITPEEDVILRHIYANPSQNSVLKNMPDYYAYLTYENCNSEESIGSFHPGYQLLLERICKHMSFTPYYLYSLQKTIDEKFIRICNNIHLNHQRIQASNLHRKVYELHKISRNIPPTDRQITSSNIQSYYDYCKYVFPMLQKFSEQNEFNDHFTNNLNNVKNTNSLNLSKTKNNENNENNEDYFDCIDDEVNNDDNDNNNEDNEDNKNLIYNEIEEKLYEDSNQFSSTFTQINEKIHRHRTKLKSHFEKESIFQTLWDNQNIYETLNNIMTRYDEEGKLSIEERIKRNRQKKIFENNEINVKNETIDDINMIKKEFEEENNEEIDDTKIIGKIYQSNKKNNSQTQRSRKSLQTNTTTVSTTNSIKRKDLKSNSWKLKHGGLPIQPQPWDSKIQNNINITGGNNKMNSTKDGDNDSNSDEIEGEEKDDEEDEKEDKEREERDEIERNGYNIDNLHQLMFDGNLQRTRRLTRSQRRLQERYYKNELLKDNQNLSFLHEFYNDNNNNNNNFDDDDDDVDDDDDDQSEDNLVSRLISDISEYEEYSNYYDQRNNLIFTKKPPKKKRKLRADGIKVKIRKVKRDGFEGSDKSSEEILNSGDEDNYNSYHTTNITETILSEIRDYAEL